MISQGWLHIGTEKTGTTSIQEFLARNRAKLLRLGYLYPRSLGTANHIALACYSQDDHKLDSTRRAYGLSAPEDVVRYRAKVLAELTEEIGSNQAGQIIFSNEHLSSRLTNKGEIYRIKGLCDTYAAKTRVIVYLRNQVDFLVSRYIETVKGGSTRRFSGSISPAVMKLMNYERLLAPWREVFGPDNLAVIRFEPEDLQGGDLLADFETRIGLSPGSLQRTERLNQALSAECVEFLRCFNGYVPHVTGGRRNPMRGQVVNFLERLDGGQPFRISLSAADLIEARFEESNERVAREYFGSKYRPLFSKPKVCTATPSPELAQECAEIIRIAAHLWTEQQCELIGFQKGTKSQAIG